MKAFFSAKDNTNISTKEEVRVYYTYEKRLRKNIPDTEAKILKVMEDKLANINDKQKNSPLSLQEKEERNDLQREIEQIKMEKVFKVYQRDSFADTWRYIDERKTLDEAQELGRSRAKRVIELGLFENGVRKGMMSWFEEPKPVKAIPEASANFDYSPEVELERKKKSKSKNVVELKQEEKAPTVLESKRVLSLQK